MSEKAFKKIQAGLNEALAYAKADNKTYSCGCIGPQNGDPLCPCMMRSVTVENGRYVQKIDHGPAKAGGGKFLDEFQTQMARIFE